MCGIAVIYRLKGSISPIDEERMHLGLKLQGHRGPDAMALWADQKVVLGHNRLSIIDLSDAANQPFYRKDFGLSIAFNGEIYNYKSLKQKLSRKGYHFFTSSDTEVILAAYREYGSTVCEQLVGMFAFSIYNHMDQSIFITKDRFGEKPIFFIQDEDQILFASELNSLRAIYGKELHINQNAVVDLVENMYINLHHTIYKEVKVFQPGHSLLIKNNQLDWEKYYSLPTETKNKIPFLELKKEVKSRLYSIVENELNADVPVATFLSSGVDSALISAIAKDIKPDIHAVTMATRDAHSDESIEAKEFAKKLKIDQEIVNVDTDSLEVLERILKNIQPLADASLIPSFIVTESVKDRCKVMLSGDGGDEIFGSYNKPNMYLKAGNNGIYGGAFLIESALKSRMGWVESLANTKLNDNNRMKLGGWSGLYKKHNLNNTLLGKVFKNQNSINRVHKVFLSLEEAFADNPEKISFGVDYLTRLPGDFLYKVDAAAMHSSVEVRAPFLDHTLIDFMMGVETRSMMPNGIDKELTKSILSDFTGYVHVAPKKGFSIPYASFMQRAWGDVLQQYLEERLSEPHFDFNYKGILALLAEHREKPSQKNARVLFSVLVLEIWLRVFHFRQDSTLSH